MLHVLHISTKTGYYRGEQRLVQRISLNKCAPAEPQKSQNIAVTLKCF